MSTLIIHPDGQVRCLYQETIDLGALGALRIARAASVEPDDGGRWWADLSPVAGPVLGPFLRRSQALAAEHDWLAAHLEAVGLSTAKPGVGAEPD